MAACFTQLSMAIPRAADKMISFWNARVNQWEAEWLNIGPRRMEFGEPNEGTVRAEGAGAARRLFLTSIPRRMDEVALEIEKEDGRLRTDITICKVSADGSSDVLWHKRVSSKPESDSWTPTLATGEPAVLIVSFRSTVDWPGQKFEYEISYEPRPDRSETAPVRDGFADLHLHQMAAQGFAGLWYWPPGDMSMKAAPMKSVTGTPLAEKVARAPIHAVPLWPGGDKAILHGPPNPKSLDVWPRFNDIAHQQVHMKWLKSAHDRGLKLAVVSMVNFEPLCYALKWLHPRQHNKWSCRDMHSVERQIEAAKELADKYPWYRIAVHPWHAREIIHDGDLAVVLSMEVSHPFPGGLPGGEGDYLAQLDRFWGMGLRSMQLAHETNSKFAGAAPHRSLFAFFEFLKHPPVPIPDNVVGGKVSNEYGFDTNAQDKNEKGLTKRGRQLLDEMMDRHMLIDIAHLSEQSVRDVYGMVQSRNYYPIYDSHTRLKGILTKKVRDHQKEFLTTCEQAAFIEKTGGMVGLRTGMNEMLSAPSSEVPNECHGSSQSYAQLVDFTAGRTGLKAGFGSDLNGMATQVAPRFGSKSCPVGGDPSGQERLGAAFDSVGLSHVGQLPNLLRDLKSIGAKTSRLENSAEAFLQMWERTWAESRGPKQVITECSPPWGGGVRTIVIEGRERPGSTGYTVEVSGSITHEAGELAGRPVSRDPSDRVDSVSARGQVRSGADGFRFSGDVHRIDVGNPEAAAVYVDGEEYHTVVIDGREGSGSSEYEIDSPGGIEQVDGTVQGVQVTANRADSVRADSAVGRVADAADGFVVTGGLPVVRLDDPSAASIAVDRLSHHTVVIDGASSTAETDYRILAPGGLTQVDGRLAGRTVTANQNDSVSAVEASGHVARAADGFVVRGEVRDVRLDAPMAADVYVDGRPFHTVVIDGSEGDGESDYRIRTAGELEQVDGQLQGRSVTTNDGDEVSGGLAKGHVANAADGYRVYGSIEEIDLTRESAAAVYVDGVDWGQLLEQMLGGRRDSLRRGVEGIGAERPGAPPEMPDSLGRESPDDTVAEEEGAPTPSPGESSGGGMSLVPRAGLYLSGVSSVEQLSGAVDSAGAARQSPVVAGASLVFGGRESAANVRMSGLKTMGSLASTGGGETGSLVRDGLLLLTGELVIRPVPGLPVQPFLVGGAGGRRLTVRDPSSGSDPTTSWKATAEVGAGIDLGLGGGDALIQAEVVDFITKSSGSGAGLQHDALFLLNLWLPLF